MTFIFIGIFWQELSILLFGDSTHFISILLLDITVFVALIERYALLLVRMKQRGKVYSIIRIINSLANAVFTILYALLIDKTFYAVIIGLIFSYVLLLLLLFMRKKFGVPKHILIKNIKAIIKYGLPFVPTFIVIWIFQSIDRIAIRNYCDFAEVGIYTATLKLYSYSDSE